MRSIYTALFILLSVAGYAQGNSSAILHGSHDFQLTAPTGWVLDTVSGVKQGLHVVFYPEGENWADAVAVMYVNTVVFDQKHPDLKSAMEADLAHFKSLKANIEVEEVEDQPLAGKRVAKIRKLFNTSDGHYVLAYIGEQKSAVVAVMSSQNMAAIEGNMSSFKELLRSYEYVKAKVANTGSAKKPAKK